jgi:hypothetical protein
MNSSLGFPQIFKRLFIPKEILGKIIFHKSRVLLSDSLFYRLFYTYLSLGQNTSVNLGRLAFDPSLKPQTSRFIALHNERCFGNAYSSWREGFE